MKKIALITGATSKIGPHIANNLAKQGYDIAIHYNSDKKNAIKLQKEILKLKKNAQIFQSDLTNFDNVNNLIDNINQEMGNISLLINNAAFFKNDNITKFDFTNFQEHINLNLTCPILLSEKFYKQINSNYENYNIINILDYCVFNYPNNFFSYTLSKSSLKEATKILSINLAPKIRVNAIAIGNICKNEKETDQHFEKSYKSSLLEIPTNIEEINNSINLIISSQSMTGNIIKLDSGKSIANNVIY